MPSGVGLVSKPIPELSGCEDYLQTGLKLTVVVSKEWDYCVAPR
jgi:hypothetical protein